MVQEISKKINNMNNYLWGVDLGGTKIEGVVMNAETNEILIRKRIPTEADNGYEHIINQIRTLIDLLITETKIQPKRIGFSTPGTLDPSLQTMKNCNTTCMNGQPMKVDIEAALGVPIEMANDANCFALAEATMGAVPEQAPDAKVVFGVILGTGVGGGVVVNGKIIGGRHGIGGEWGHNVSEENGTPCYCGKSGCNEKVFAGPALEAYYAKISREDRQLKEIYERHLAGTDEHATATMNRLVKSLGKALHYVVNVIDPDVIVFGGGVSNIDLVYTEAKTELENWIFNNRKVETLFLRPKLGDSAGVFGAIELVRN
jgi:predicted NBD/HSP70 family sugar kinase